MRPERAQFLAWLAQPHSSLWRNTSPKSVADAAESQSRRNIDRPFFAPRQPGASRRMAMELAGIAMFGFVVLWIVQAFDRSSH
jgi:hypothetical protein